MHFSVEKTTRGARTYGAGLVVSVVAGLAGLSSAQADEAYAKDQFRAMSDYLAAQETFSFDYDSSLEVVTTKDQKLQLASSGAATVHRPDKIRATRRGGFADVEMTFDGKTLSLLGKDANAYAQADVPGDIDTLIDTLRDKYQRPVPAADLLSSNVYDQLMPLVTDVKDLGSGVIRGVECDHFAFRAGEADFQIWIAQGDSPYPCRYVITTPGVTGSPQYTIDVRDWKTGGEVASVDFAFSAPAGAKQMDFADLPDLDELPAMFNPKGAQ